MESLNLQVVAVLIPHEIIEHIIPHFKALTVSIEHANAVVAIYIPKFLSVKYSFYFIQRQTNVSICTELYTYFYLLIARIFASFSLVANVLVHNYYHPFC